MMWCIRIERNKLDKQIQINAQAVLKSFISDLEVIEREVDSKLKDAEKQINDNNKLAESLKIQVKEGEKRIQDKLEGIGVEAKKQESISKQLTEELAKQSIYTKDIEKMKVSAEENLKVLHTGKDEILAELDKKKKLTIQVKAELEKQEKLLNENIERAKKLDDEFKRVDIKEAQVNMERSKLEKEKIDFNDRQMDLSLRIKTIERLEKNLKLKNASWLWYKFRAFI